MEPITREEAKKRVKKVKDFYTHLFTFIVINIFLLVLNLVTSPDTLWFYWVTIPWGVGLAFHWYDTYFGDGILGRKWEERKIRKYMDKGKQH